MSRKEKKAKKPMKKSTKILIGMFLVLCVISAFVDDSETNSNVAVEDSNTQIEEQQPIDIVEEDPIVEPEVDSEPVEEALPDILTVDNCEDLRVLLTSDIESELYHDFYEKYKGKTVQFDAHIDYWMHHGDYKSRYTFIMSYGDYIDDNTPTSGPTFRVENVNPYDVGIGLAIGNLYDWFYKGANVTVTTELGQYDDDHCNWPLNPYYTTIERR